MICGDLLQTTIILRFITVSQWKYGTEYTWARTRGTTSTNSSTNSREPSECYKSIYRSIL